MPALAAYMHHRRMQLGTYSDEGTSTCGGCVWKRLRMVLIAAMMLSLVFCGCASWQTRGPRGTS